MYVEGGTLSMVATRVVSDSGLDRALNSSGDPSSDCRAMKHPVAVVLVMKLTVTATPLLAALTVAFWTSNVAVDRKLAVCHNIHIMM